MNEIDNVMWCGISNESKVDSRYRDMEGRVVRDGTFLGDDTRDGNDRVKVGRAVGIGN